MGLFDQLPAPKRPAEFEAEDLSHGKAPRLGAAPGADRLLALQARVPRALLAKKFQSSGRDDYQRPRGCDTNTAGAAQCHPMSLFCRPLPLLLQPLQLRTWLSPALPI